ncbi:MAG: CDP-glucose 4,6-dehydratase [Candidatus Niyogibacteria bacterium]|nr:CDP-glucose 4,6-dehydratase [Candidatus Niyogibacteria bacterium]
MKGHGQYGNRSPKARNVENLKNFFNKKRVLITGHTGFKGSWLCQMFLLWGADVSGIALAPSTTPNLFSVLGIQPRIHHYIADIRDGDAVGSIFNKEKPEVVFHLAAQPIVRESYNNPLYTFETNIIGTANVLEAIRKTSSVRAAVMVTTDKVYKNKETAAAYTEDNPLGGHDPYSASKASAELVIRSYQKSFFHPDGYDKIHAVLIASARAGNMIGGGDWGPDRIMTDIVRSVFERNEKMLLRNPESVRPWQFVLEPLAGYAMLAKGLYEGRKELSDAWNFGPKDANHLQVKDIVRESFAYLNKGSYIIHRDPVKPEALFLKIDSAKARKHLGWRSRIHARDALTLALNWYKTYYTKGIMADFTNQQITEFFKKIRTV